MTSYAGRHAKLYDIFYGDKPYAAEAAFVHQQLALSSGKKPRRVLELACGTGGHAFELESLGYDVVATDHSEDMLERARAKAAERGSQVRFEQRDMRELDLGGEVFDAAVCLFDSIGYVRTNEAVGEVLEGLHRHLRPGAPFVFEFWHAAAMVRGYDPFRVRRWHVPSGEIVRVSETTLDAKASLALVKYTVYELGADGTWSSFEETQVNRYFLVQEMAAWLSRCGFEPAKFYAGFSDDQTITDETWHVVAVARSLQEESA